MNSHLLLILRDGAEVGLHLSDASLQRHNLVDDDIGVLDLLQLGGREDGQLPRWLVLDGMQGQLAGLGEPKEEGEEEEKTKQNRMSMTENRSKATTFGFGRGPPPPSASA